MNTNTTLFEIVMYTQEATVYDTYHRLNCTRRFDDYFECECPEVERIQEAWNNVNKAQHKLEMYIQSLEAVIKDSSPQPV